MALSAVGHAEPIPELTRRDVGMEGAGRPQTLLETTEVVIRRFRDVPEDFAVAEGEGSCENWREDHIRYFARNGDFDLDMELVCERFGLVQRLDHPAG
jgi:Uncharacterized protein conserved in bacteria